MLQPGQRSQLAPATSHAFAFQHQPSQARQLAHVAQVACQMLPREIQARQRPKTCQGRGWGNCRRSKRVVVFGKDGCNLTAAQVLQYNTRAQFSGPANLQNAKQQQVGLACRRQGTNAALAADYGGAGR